MNEPHRHHRWRLQEQTVPGVWSTFSSSPTREAARRTVRTLRERTPARAFRVLDTWSRKDEA